MVTRNENAVTFSVQDEDHTLANPVRFMLNKNPHVSFTGYSITHPAEKILNLRVQTTGEITSTEAFRQALNSVIDVCQHVKSPVCSLFSNTAMAAMKVVELFCHC
ncbi:hypothetical protein WJX84_009645 [Apatococcus fuscideae]|uniref:DNA-directed RNA polymerase RBP11-like dimerisation domain-containing protein n=1 Tax=Apatococcus fuscideae TaxID=2026836 RepID=A0AAW1TED2_9CHLO